MSASLPRERCNRCRFWLEDMAHRDPNDEDFGFGWCRRNPPRVIDPIVATAMPPLLYGQQVDCEIDSLQMLDASKFPSTSSTDWCGEYDDARAASMPV